MSRSFKTAFRESYTRQLVNYIETSVPVGAVAPLHTRKLYMTLHPFKACQFGMGRVGKPQFRDIMCSLRSLERVS